MDCPWPPQSIINQLTTECAGKGLLYLPPPCDSSESETNPSERSRRVNLGMLHVAKVNAADNLVETRPDLREAVERVRHRASKLQFPLLTEHMVSGYGGFVPKNQFQLGKTYRETCIKSIAELEAEKSGKTSEDQCQTQSSQMGITAKPNSVAFKTIEDFGKNSYIRSHDLTNSDYVSPYKMANDDPEKYYKSGFAGFIPRTQNKIGTNIEVTHNALNEFTDGQNSLEKSSPRSC